MSIPWRDFSADHLRLTTPARSRYISALTTITVLKSIWPRHLYASAGVATEILRFSFAENEDDQQVVFQIDRQNHERRPSKLVQAALLHFTI
jgi:hypothetical protein